MPGNPKIQYEIVTPPTPGFQTSNKTIMLAACGGGPGMDAGYLRNLVMSYPSLLLDWAREDEEGHPLSGRDIQLQAQARYIEACRRQASQELGLVPDDLLLIPVCHSAGGSRGVAWAAQYPENIAGLVLIDAQIIPPVYPYSPFWTTLCLLAYAALHWRGGLEGAFRARFMELVGKHYFVRPTPENKQAFTQSFVSPFIHLIQQSGFTHWDVQQSLDVLQVPMLVMHGESDQIFSLESARQQVEALGARAQLCLIPEAGHLPMMERPLVTAEALRSFIEPMMQP